MRYTRHSKLKSRHLPASKGSAKKSSPHATVHKADEAAMIGTPYPPDKAAELVRNLENKQLGKRLTAAVEIIENYSRVAKAVIKNPELNMTPINQTLNSTIEKNLQTIINRLVLKRPPIGLQFLANSSVITSNAVREAARNALAKQ